MPELADPAATVEHVGCSTYDAPTGSACHTRGGKLTPKRHTPRFMPVPQLRAELGPWRRYVTRQHPP
ncbi:hypothetical protein ACIQU6_38225 [Streptomyces sp. NPDC090442]|uniref:hypothetical protein n=1 Tax=Streptomyces sp. NPDC090442 TaxID=3365962 RepID=UPI00380422FA